MPKVDWNDGLAKLAEDACQNIARMTAELVLGESQLRVPKELGGLEGSGAVNPVKNGYEIAYTQPHAVVQHEKQFSHYTKAGTGPNYLRGPLLESEDQYHKDIADALKTIFG